ncbi:inner centromere protein A-like [Dreissena polymorpha]|uniref:Uncharacterized protein n=1 Tax=Dreissena polymorpha TaxID=45954 RepID=A0A9D4N242_DREPO|nr:inner centromere protein A-like [Dreissena polymorpha]XP_052233366.1 inner centromere protein A-like [Dreissena polymorpha]XP_052233376.1 inner centromere protein A-like [Dreissena polymorpha]KAH3888247.1 hypothetical protein DPMN_012279 [Dreissena polymorpha]
MGNNHSRQPVTPSTDVVRSPPARPDAPPSARPVSSLGPQGPTYNNPVNRVLPKELPSILKLRPVSMELSKYNSDYENLYSYQNEGTDVDANKNNIEKNDQPSGSEPQNDMISSAPAPPMNGYIPNGSPPVVPPVSNGDVQSTMPVPSVSTKQAPYRPSHRRQMSLGQQEHTIMEEPEESIESRVKLDPFMQSYPGAVGPSLPVKNNFNLDYSYQLTYVQLAEHRRSKTIEELEKRTGKKLSDLTADLNEHSEKPAFVRESASRVSSRSAGSALSSKKKKAPAPPVQVPPPHSSKSTPSTPRKDTYSVDNEPPIDYDIESPRRPPPPAQNFKLPRYSVVPVSRSQSSVKMPPAPPPPPMGMTTKQPNTSLTRSESLNAKPELVLKRTPDLKPAPKTADANIGGQVPWLLEMKNLSETKAARRQQSQEKQGTATVDAEEEKNETKNSSTVNGSERQEPAAKLVFESAKNETDSVQPKANIERSNSMKDKDLPVSGAPKVLRHSSTTTYDRLPQPSFQRQSSDPAELGVSQSSTDPVRRLNSLLQHDIMTAANAKCVKVVKQTTPVPPKPKDPHTVFREQLQKACAARDERAKVEGTIDDKLKQNTSNTSLDMEEVLDDDKPSSSRKESTASSRSSEPPEILPKPPRYHKNVTMNKTGNVYSKAQKASVGPNASNRQQVPASQDWTPEDDLDSDDDISDREIVTGRNASADGFKSTIIPKSMNDLKVQKNSKKDKKANKLVQNEEQKAKFGSVKRFKKSMHKGVRNAFGSISKASGKILRRQKAEDLETVDDTPKNWSLDASSGENSTSRSNGYHIPKYGEYDDDPDDSDVEQNGLDHDAAEVEYRTNRLGESDNSDEDIDEPKFVSPRYEKVKSLDRKKHSNDHFRKENLSLERATEERWAKERKLEEEKRKQLELELEMHKLREAETRERLKRLETAHLQQQLAAAQLLQQQQQHYAPSVPHQNLSLMPAPTLPPVNGFHNYGTLPDPNQPQNFSNTMFNQQMPRNGFQSNFGHYSQTSPFLSTSMSGSMPYDLNEYMRMLSVPTPPTSQQMAFFLNSMTLTGQPFERKSNPLLFDMFSKPQYPSSGDGFQRLDPTDLKKQGFQSWASSPNINSTASVNTGNGGVQLSDFVASYNGANSGNNSVVDPNDMKVKPTNPLYNSDSDSELSPGKTVVARVQVKDYRKVPVRTESGKFMKKYASEHLIPSGNLNFDTNSTQSLNRKSSFDISEQLNHHRQRSVSPSNSVSTVDSAISSSVTLSTPSSPTHSVGAPGSPQVCPRSHSSTPSFRTVVDLSNPVTAGSAQIIVSNVDDVKL